MDSNSGARGYVGRVELMVVVIVLLIMMSMYMGLHEKIDDNYKVGWFVFVGVVVLLYVVFGILL